MSFMINRFAKRAGLLVLLGLCCPLTAGCGSGYIVKPGNVALVVSHYSGRIDSRVRHAGFNPQPPFSGNEIIEIPTYVRTYTMVRDSNEGSHQGDDSVAVNTLSNNTLHVDTSISYNIAYDSGNDAALVALYMKYRNQFQDFSSFEDQQLRPAFRQAIVDAFGLKNTTDLMTGAGKREAAAYAKAQLTKRFAPDSIMIDDVRIRAIYPDDATVASLRTRLQAQQNLRLAQFNMQLQSLINQKKVLAAQADAEATHIRAASLSPRLVKFKHIKDITFVGVPNGAIVNASPTSPENQGT